MLWRLSCNYIFPTHTSTGWTKQSLRQHSSSREGPTLLKLQPKCMSTASSNAPSGPKKNCVKRLRRYEATTYSYRLPTSEAQPRHRPHIPPSNRILLLDTPLILPPLTTRTPPPRPPLATLRHLLPNPEAVAAGCLHIAHHHLLRLGPPAPPTPDTLLARHIPRPALTTAITSPLGLGHPSVAHHRHRTPTPPCRLLDSRRRRRTVPSSQQIALRRSSYGRHHSWRQVHSNAMSGLLLHGTTTC